MKVNIMDSAVKIKNILLFGDPEKRSLADIDEEIGENNRASVRVFSLIASVVLMGLAAASFLVPTLKDFQPLYIMGFFVVFTIYVLVKGPARKNHRLTTGLMYIFTGFLFLLGIFMGTIAGPNELTATYIALLLTVPQMFVDRPSRFISMIFGSVVIFVVMVFRFKNPVTWSSDIVNAITFSFLSSACCAYNMKIKIERMRLENTVRYMAETDQLTNLKNRNSYEQRLMSNDILKASSIYCVYVDVNGLHELNDTEGHAAGDRMLQYVATVMQNLFGKNDTYRIGGDEFIAMGTGRDAEEIQEMIQRMKIAVEVAGYHIAVGMDYRSKTELALNDLVQQAEIRMYQDKSEFYQTSGKERRKR